MCVCVKGFGKNQVLQNSFVMAGKGSQQDDVNKLAAVFKKKFKAAPSGGVRPCLS